MTERNLAQKLDLQPGKFYSYYKPSFANYDPEYAVQPTYANEDTGDLPIPMEFRYPTPVDQLLNRKYRDELEFDSEFAKSDDFMKSFAENRFLLTKPFMDNVFDQCFEKRSYTVQFLFNPDVKRFK